MCGHSKTFKNGFKLETMTSELLHIPISYIPELSTDVVQEKIPDTQVQTILAKESLRMSDVNPPFEDGGKHKDKCDTDIHEDKVESDAKESKSDGKCDSDGKSDSGVSDGQSDSGVSDGKSDSGVSDGKSDNGVNDDTSDSGVNDDTSDRDAQKEHDDRNEKRLNQTDNVEHESILSNTDVKPEQEITCDTNLQHEDDSTVLIDTSETEIQKTLQKNTLKELKEKCTQQKLPIHGRKHELISRLMNQSTSVNETVVQIDDITCE